ncbi:long-chain fatty acid--CoA ligase [Chelatococcus reniformis]|uniref:3-methylmercaptopropionyl-CoA ligase n=1 Tax=Chelatococcus reniformis TaxID=1494448 RepID=A0A916UDQ1_9HYPH|nr:long-chain fatty acid--CoA ligase [Chelatococcus reniformis]GGC68116.1 long-chain-fatty-acid--CoA ligase [Chelatococcus reniformis]
MRGLMMDMPLLLSGFVEYAGRYHGDVEVVAREIEGDIHRYTYADALKRIKRMAKALKRLGADEGTVVGTLAWNTHRHFEMFYAAPGIGAVLHTVNPRLFADQIVYIVNHAEDRILFVDKLTLPIIEEIAPRLTTVEAIVVMAAADRMPETRLANVHCYETLIAGETDENFRWPVLDENSASTICYTSGTTGDPKGVVYSHRAAVLQTLLGANFTFLPGHRSGKLEVMMPMAPMFHGNAWNMPFLACYTGSKLVLPGRNYEPDKLYELFEGEKVTLTAGVPSFWLILLDWLKRTGNKFSTLRLSLSSGSAPPRSMVETLDRDYGVEYVQAWGMTEALMATMPTPKPRKVEPTFEQRIDDRMKSGRVAFGVDARIVTDDGTALPHDGVSVGHLRVRAPWIASAYHKGIQALDGDGYLMTGDMAVIDPDGYISLTDRSKDVIKSGGEWISSIQLEDAAASHPDVLQCAVIAIPHEKWQERPLLLVVPRQGATLDGPTLLAHMAPRVAKWWLPDAVEFLDAFPMTGTGKVHKLTLRQQFKNYTPAG